MLMGVACGVLLAVARLSGKRVPGGLATARVEVARNTPALFQIYMAHFGLGTFWYIVLPQMFRISFPPMTNQMVRAILMTSLGIMVGMATDLAGVTQSRNVKTFRTFEFFAMAAVLYCLIAKTVMLGARLMAWRLFRY
jgi:polar amino acid transport system permease protein